MIVLKSAKELERMKQAGKIVYLTHQELKKVIRPGITTRELDQLAEKVIRGYGATASFKGYNGFPGSVCTSVNNELVHGIPGNRKLQEGDIISIDIGACYEGYHGDSAWTYAVGKISPEAEKLLAVTEASLYKGLEQAKPGARLGDISHAIQVVAEQAGFSIVREYVGHGIGQNLHEAPSVPNYGLPGKGIRLKPGMTLAVEPMVNMGSRFVRTLTDNWTVVTTDGSLCAHFEHTIAITDEGHEILTTA
ncbi:type I methionyl aminopeptidase [Paenactinomyces guangxiensis]|uniref:Methionine aminopeptidase n=1 Tax=Paenactinomyces guangxiensis TaxID=1490290 RepID=A0A7W1WTS7_9BACL|nr:type I methionyl aminopeptidase [Paenactinomyces guangxiensis]MBA4495910.1 type I methionyl aminopeptidase [Paenactinomyces guangxiensis]MBH8592953.1 type I methionyl aminopeptidase [Paenactinomyces guangxiensis]